MTEKEKELIKAFWIYLNDNGYAPEVYYDYGLGPDEIEKVINEFSESISS